MIAMPWMWGMSIPVPLSVAVFTAAALWYAFRALFRPASAAGPGDGHPHHGPVLLWYHAAMMAAMVWMAVLMSMVGIVSLPGWSIALSVSFVLLFAVATLWYLVRLVRAPTGDPRAHPALPPAFDTLLSFAMAIGMGAGFLLML